MYGIQHTKNFSDLFWIFRLQSGMCLKLFVFKSSPRHRRARLAAILSGCRLTAR